LAFARPGDDDRSLDHFLSGEPVLVQLAVLDFDGAPPPPDAPAHVLVGSGVDVLKLSLNDQGQNGDQHSGDGVHSVLLRGTDRGSPTGFDEDGSGPGAIGSYSVEAEIDFGSVAAPRILTTRGAFAVLREATVADTDGDGLPDRFEARHACLNPAIQDASADADGDGASTSVEYQAGSDPCDVDSDEGGETDGSEIARAVSPLDANDDGVRRIKHVEIVRQLTDHEDVADLTPLANTLRFGSDPGFAQVVIKRAPAPAGPFVDVATINAAAANGQYIDAGLVNGQMHCYQLVGQTAGGRVAAASDTVCGTARNDSTAPRGSIVLNQGAPRASNPMLTAQLSIDGEPAIGMEMSLRFPDGTDSGWIPFAPNASVDASSLVVPSMATVSVMFRDASGNESGIYTDDIEVISIAERGRIIGAAVVAVAFGGGPISGVNVLPDAETAQPSESAPNGNFMLDNLPAGTYALTLERHGFVPRTIPSIVLATGDTVDLGDVELIPQVLFRDSFE